jgi:dinuclear metal center YbgI/SA1388 family protein
MSAPELAAIADYLTAYLRHPGFPDYSLAANGLQLANSGRVTKLGAAVDACEAVLAEAVRHGISLLLVHHGLMWEQHSFAFTGARYRKLKLAIESDLAIFSSHLPLDAHPEIGNAAQLAAKIGLQKVEPFFPYKTETVGMCGELEISVEDLAQRIHEATQASSKPVICRGGPETVRKIGIVTGGAGSEVAEIARSGVDTFITGEGPHWSYTAAEELGLNVIYAGHYATETFGVKALAAHLAEKFTVPWEFIDHPTGL